MFHVLYYYFPGSAETRFDNLRQRYRKKKNAVIKAKPSGTGRTKKLEEAEASLRVYDFLKWLDPYIAGASSVSNLDDDNDATTRAAENEVTAEPDLPPDTQEDSEDSDDEQRDNKVSVKERNTEKLEEDEEEDEEEELVQVKTDSKKKNSAPKKQLKKCPDGVPSFTKSNVACDEVLKTTSKRMLERKEERMEKMARKAEEKEADESDVFGKMVAFELRCLPKRKQAKLKHDINFQVSM